jgi:hypothetical protein
MCVSAGERTMDTIDALSVGAERNHNLKKAKLEMAFITLSAARKYLPVEDYLSSILLLESN